MNNEPRFKLYKDHAYGWVMTVHKNGKYINVGVETHSLKLDKWYPLNNLTVAMAGHDYDEVMKYVSKRLAWRD